MCIQKVFLLFSSKKITNQSHDHDRSIILNVDHFTCLNVIKLRLKKWTNFQQTQIKVTNLQRVLYFLCATISYFIIVNSFSILPKRINEDEKTRTNLQNNWFICQHWNEKKETDIIYKTQFMWMEQIHVNGEKIPEIWKLMEKKLVKYI